MMNKLFFFLIPAMIIVQYSFDISGPNGNFSGNRKTTGGREIRDSVADTVFTTDQPAVMKDFSTWYNYTYYHIHLSQDFIGLNSDSVKIDKGAFLDQMLSGNEVAFEIKTVGGSPVYQLFKYQGNDESIRTAAKQMASLEMAHFKMEGTQIPDFRFTGLNGKVYDPSSTKGKLVVLNCWFIHCPSCVKEFPELNQMVEENQGRKDLLFLGLAMDSKEDLIKFLKTKEFSYTVIPSMTRYMEDQLKLTEFPTQILIDRSGKIIKVVNRFDELVPFLHKELAKS